MFEKATNKVLQWLDHDRMVGSIYLNTKHDFKEKTQRPILKNKGCEVLSFGRVNYVLLDQFIMTCLNDYYQKINEAKQLEERQRRTEEYNNLYQLWYRVNVAKQTNDFNLNSYYDDIVYRLYVIGYHS